VQVKDGWSLDVVSAQPDATAVVLAENQFNKPPAPGNQFYLVTVNVVRTGVESKSFDGSRLKAVGPGAVGYTTFNNGCGVYPGGGFNYGDSPELFTGGSAQGNICWQVASADAAGLVMYYDPLVSFSDSDRVYFAFH